MRGGNSLLKVLVVIRDELYVATPTTVLRSEAAGISYYYWLNRRAVNVEPRDRLGNKNRHELSSSHS